MRPLHPKLLFLALVFTVAILPLDASAQSGRKKTQPPAPLPVATPPPSVTVERMPAKITTLVVCGEITTDSLYFHSSLLSLVTKEFIFWMKYEPRPFLGVTKGGKMKFEDAKEAAMKETDRHLLWLGVALKSDGYGGMYVDYVDYAILLPQTGRSLFTGQLIPGDEKIFAQGGVMKIPTMQKRTTVSMQLKQVARELSFKLKATSWF
jgi:hypothetical protein